MKNPRFILASAALAALFIPTVHAVDFNWTNGAGDNDWFNGLNWNSPAPGTVPFGGGGNFVLFSAGASGAANLNASPADVQDWLWGNDGSAGSRTLNQTAGTANLTGWFRMGITDGGRLPGGNNAYNLSGGQLNAGRYDIAEGVGTLGTVNVTGGTLRQFDGNPADGNNWSRVGQGGVATVNLSGTGTMSFDSRVLIGADPGSSGTTVTQTGGTFEVRRGEFTLGDVGGTVGAPIVYNMSSGILRTLSAIDDDDQGANVTVGQWDNSNAILNVSGDSIVQIGRDFNVGNGRVEAPSTGTINQSGGNITVTRNLNIANFNASENGTYNLTGGVLNMTAGNINKGGDDSFNFNGGRVQDAANINFALAQNGGTLAPGASAGVTTINGDYTESALGILEIELFSAGSFDVLNVNGLTNLAGNLDVIASGGLALNDTFLILLNDGVDPISGIFTGKATSFLEDGYEFEISYVAGDGNDVSLRVIPEPSALAMLLGGTGMLTLLRRRRW